MRSLSLWLMGSALWVYSSVLWAQSSVVHVFACEPEWAALAHTIGGDKVTVYSATTAMQDPHHIQARPRLIAEARRADLIVCAGADLESGWLPILLQRSGNAAIQPGRIGYFMATDYVDLLGKPQVLDRSHGHIHATGNPHIHFNPLLMLQVSEALVERMIKIAPEHQAVFQSQQVAFANQLNQALDQWQAHIQSLAGQHIVVYHDSWAYLAQWLQLIIVATLESKPGIPPSSSHLAHMVKQLSDQPEAQPIAMILYASYQNPRASQWLANKTDIPAVALPYSVADWQRNHALIDWYQQLLQRLSAHQISSASQTGSKRSDGHE